MKTDRIIATMPIGAAMLDAPSTELKPQFWAVCQNALPHQMQLRQRDGHANATAIGATGSRACIFDRTNGDRDIVLLPTGAGYSWNGTTFVAWGTVAGPTPNSIYVPSYTGYADRFYAAGLDTLNLDSVVYIDAGGAATANVPGANQYQATQTKHVAQAIAYFGNHLMLGNVIEDGVQYHNRVRWSATGDDANWDTSTDPSTGYADAIEGPGQILAMLPFGADLLIYREESISICRYLGDLPPFAFALDCTTYGLWAPMTLLDIGEGHVFLSRKGVIAYRGCNRAEPIDQAINRSLMAELSTLADDQAASVQRAAWAMWDPIRRLYWLFYPASDTTGCYRAWVCNIGRDGGYTWFKQTYVGLQPCGNFIKFQTLGDSAVATIGWLGGRIMGPSYKSDGASAIDFDLQSPDFLASEEHLNRFKRWLGAELEARGAASTDTLIVQYSTDRGSTWNTISASPLTLAATIGLYEVWFDASAKLLRIRFRNNTAGHQPTLRSYQLKFTVQAEY